MSPKPNKTLPVVMTVAGLDPSGGAGILADTRTLAAFNCYPIAVVTAITFQNSSGVSGYVPEKPETVAGQMLPVFAELPVAAVKTGMLPTVEIVGEVSRVLDDHIDVPLVIDPVMSSTSGYELMDESALTEMKERLMPRARVVTPNIPEAERLVGFPIRDVEEMQGAAETIRAMGVRAVLIKGGHLKGSIVKDVLNDEGTVAIFKGERIGGMGFRGTGCTLASAIAALLAHGNTLERSVELAREFVVERMHRALQIGVKEVLY